MEKIGVYFLVVLLGSGAWGKREQRYLSKMASDRCLNSVDFEISAGSLAECAPKCFGLEEGCMGLAFNHNSNVCSISSSDALKACTADPDKQTYSIAIEPTTSTTSTSTTTTSTTTTSTTSTTTTSPMPTLVAVTITLFSEVHGGYGTTTNAYDGDITTKFCSKAAKTYSYATVKLELASVTQLKEIILRGDSNYATGLSKLRINVGLSSTPNMFRWEYGAVCCNPMSYTVDTPMETKVIYLIKKVKGANFCINEIEFYGL